MTALKLGDILYSSWGYDQTNIDFYQVTRVLKASVEIRRISSKQGPEDGFMTASVTPVKDYFVGEPMVKRIAYTQSGEPNVKIKSYAWAYIWDGRPKRCSWYA